MAEENIPVRGAADYFWPHRRNSWGAIFAGAAIVMAVQFLLGVLGVAIGLVALGISPEEGTAKGVGIGAAIWWIIAASISLFAGGWVAGRLSGMFHRLEGVLHGAVTWAVATLLSVILVTSAMGAVIGGAWSVLSTGATTAAQTKPQTDVQLPTTQQVQSAAEQAQNAAGEVAKKAAGPSAAAAWGIFFMMLLGLGAAALGGAAGVKYYREDETT